MFISPVFSIIVAFASFVAAVPSIPRNASPSDGYPSPNPSQLAVISQQADGTLPNEAPAALSDATVPLIQAIAFVEEFEVAFFSSLLQNVTNEIHGYTDFNLLEKDAIVNILTNIVKQEELHAINAIRLLEAFNKFSPLPCEYSFPVNNFTAAVTLAATFSDLGLGALQYVLELVGANGDIDLIRDLTAVVGQEAEQEGFYRFLLGRNPAEKPFLTYALGSDAVSYVVNNFVVADSCSFNISDIDLPVFTALTVEDISNGLDVQPEDQTLTFNADLTNVADAAGFIGGDGTGLFVTYLSGQLKPISEPVSNVRWQGSNILFDAFFPFAENVMQGLSVAALTTSGDFDDALEVLSATLAAPGLIQVNDKF